jgi:conjugative relaxase-like TrwC/TraI family protein
VRATCSAWSRRRRSQGASSYYLDAVAEGEPPGRWLGKGAAALGLEGEVDAQVMETVYGEFKNPLTGEQIGRRPDEPKSLDDRIAAALAAEPDALPERQEEIRRNIERTARKGVLGWDTTFNVAKSVSIVHTALHRAEIIAIRDGDTERAQRAGTARRAIEHAILRGNDTGMSTLEGLLTVRTGGGSGAPLQWESAQGATIASFFQHTNRDADPHLHVHNVFLNRAAGQDGKYRALDGEDMLAQRFHGAAVSDRVMWEELAKLGLESIPRKDGMGRELCLVPAEVNNFFSGRRQQITKALKPLLEAAEERLGRKLSQRERYELAQQATLATRAAKQHGTTFTVEQTVDRWQNRLITGTGQTLTTIAEHAMNVMAAGPFAAQEWSPESVIAEAVAACTERSATWGRANLVNELELRLPILGVDPDEVPALLDRLADQGLSSADVVQVSGHDTGDYARPSATLYASATTLTAERALRDAAIQRGGHALDPVALKAWLDEHAPTLGADQRAVIEGIATSDAALSVLIGPAGSGKSFTAGTFAAAWHDQTDGAGRVIGLATSEVATKVLMDDGIAASRNISKWLDAQAAIAAGSTDPNSTEWALGPRDVVMVDEASMVSTANLDAIREHVQAAGARLVLTGDPRQLSAVGAGGAMGLLDGYAETYTLTEIRRFREEWEREASLRLRAGDPTALVDYDRHGRLVGTENLDEAIAQAARAAVADRMDGRSTVVVASTNDLAAQIAAQVRDQLIELGQVEPDGVRLGRDGNTGGIGDIVMCRRNDYGVGVNNRAQYKVLDTREDGALVVQQIPRPGQHTPPPAEPIDIPARYVADDVQLGYAGTVHAAEGLTVDNGYWVTAGGDKLSAAYVAATRGRERNTVIVALDTPATPDDLPSAVGRRGGATQLDGTDIRASALAVLEASFDRTTGGASATVTAEADAARAGHLETLTGRFEVEVRAACRDRLERHLDDLTADGTLDHETRGRLAADQSSEHLARLLRAVEQAGHDPAATLREAITAGQLDDASSVAQVLSHRITRGGQPLDLPTPETAAGTRIPAGLDPDTAARLTDLAVRIDARRDQLGHEVADRAPDWAVQALGPVPPESDVDDRADWEQRAGQIAAHREATGFDHPEHALGTMPGLSMTERRADYALAWHALGQPRERLAETEMSTGQLLARHRAWINEQAWAPPHADHALRGAEQAAETARQEAALAEAEGRVDDAAGLRAEAERQAGCARAYARVVEARGKWAGRTAYTRINGEAAKDELIRRGITPGREPDRTTARTYLTPDDTTAGTPALELHSGQDAAYLEDTAAERALIHADDAHRDITGADVTDLHPDDLAWAARLDPDAPEVQLHSAVQVSSGTFPPGQSPAYDVAQPGMSRVQLDVLLAQAQLALSIAIDQASQDHANELADQPNRARESFEAGLRRRDAARLDAEVLGHDAGTEAGFDFHHDASSEAGLDLTQEDGA